MPASTRSPSPSVGKSTSCRSSRDSDGTLLKSLPEARQLDALVELNVLEQARNVCRTTVVREAWQRGQAVHVHGWVYGLHNGLLEDLTITAGGVDEVNEIYDRALGRLLERYLCKS